MITGTTGFDGWTADAVALVQRATLPMAAWRVVLRICRRPTPLTGLCVELGEPSIHEESIVDADLAT